ncbi:hypothetical protein ACPCSC_00755 [Streptomyces lavendulocolor]|uniref:hypothetical protein n=1 Tax=Streptomyces lavendulocolor TaxID=67316 RepID=UPI003C2E6B08
MASTVNQQTDLRKVYYQCRLGRSDLDRMFVIACEGIETPAIRVSTVAGSTRFWEATLQGLLSAVQAGAPEVNERWSNVALEAGSPSGERSVSIQIDTERAEFNVSGSDATWVYGQAARLEKFLIARGAVSNSPRYEAIISSLFAAIFLGTGIAWILGGWSEGKTMAECVAEIEEAKGNVTVVNWSFAALLTFGLGIVTFQVLKRRALKAQLRVASEIPEGSWWSRLTIAEKIAAVGIPISGFATFGTLVSAASGIFSK